MNRLSKRKLRSLVIQSLAPGADDCNARGVLVDAIGQLQSDIWSLAAALETTGPAGMQTLQGAMLGLSERAKALREFADECFAIEFSPLDDEAAERGGAT